GDELDVGKERSGDGEVSSRSSEAALGFSERSLNIVECDGADDEDAHWMYLPMIGARLFFVSGGIRAGSVTIAYCSAFTHAQLRLRAAARGTIRRKIRCAISAFDLR